MIKGTISGVDLAKNVFQLHRAADRQCRMYDFIDNWMWEARRTSTLAGRGPLDERSYNREKDIFHVINALAAIRDRIAPR